MQLVKLLERECVPFTVHRHDSTTSAQRMARVMREAGDHVAKTVVLKADGEFIVAVLPATHAVDSLRIRELLKAEQITLATEDELTDLFPDCETGAVPPFGSLYGLRTIVDRALTSQLHMLFEGNTHDETLRVRYCDFERLERPQVASFSHHV